MRVLKKLSGIILALLILAVPVIAFAQRQNILDWSRLHNYTPGLAKQNQAGNSAADHFSIDIFYGNGASANSSNTSANDDVHGCSDAKPSVSVFINGTDVTGGGSVDCTGSCTVTATVSAGTHPLNDSNRPQFPGTVNLLVNGQVAQSQGVSDPTDTKTFAYTGSGSATIAVQVIDSVLYDTTSGNATVTFAAAETGPSNLSINKTGNTGTFTWTGGSAPFTVFKTSNNNPVIGCTNISGQGCSGTGVTNGSYYVQDANGNKTSGST